MPMNKEVKQAWIKALRSGEYEQGTGYLRSEDNKFCCLGVLCDIMKDRLGLEWNLVGHRYEMYGAACNLPGIVYAEARISGPVSRLIDMNDFYRNTFAEIAAYIKENL